MASKQLGSSAVLLESHVDTGGAHSSFTNVETTRRGPRARDAIDLSEPFLTAAKALTTEFLRTSGENSPSKVVAALRAIEKAFRDLGQVPDICDLTPAILDRAQDIIVAAFADAWTYGRLIERIALDYVNPARISRLPLSWRTSIQYQAPLRNDRVNAEGARGNIKQLPNIQSIFDLSSVFHNSDYIPDIVITAWFALAMFAPSRATEILGLPVNCETEMAGRYGLSWRPLKDGDPMTKFAVTEDNADVARTAIRRLIEIGEKSRVSHKWYEHNPNSLYLPDGFEHLRGQPITLWEASQIVGRSKVLTQGCAARKAMEMCGTTRELYRGAHGPEGGYLRLYTFESLEGYVLQSLPASFPYIDPRNKILGSEALFCMPDEIMRGYAETQQYIPRYLTYSQVLHELGSKPSGHTVFSRNNLIDSQVGKPWRLRTRQPRHLLNTLAQSKHLSQELIAYWSGRKSVKQNASYNHVPQEVYIEAFLTLGESAPRELKVVGPLHDKIEQRVHKESITYSQALKLEVGSTITTRYGLCRHDYSLMPCPKDKDCIRCGENTFIKGNQSHLDEARSQLEISTKARDQAEQAVSKGRYGAQRWVNLHGQKAERWRLAVARLTDPSLEDGTLITLPPVEHPQTKAGLAAAIRDAEVGVVAVNEFAASDDSVVDYLWSDDGEL